jgi:hypothetical protein
MAVYVDDGGYSYGRMIMCHMFADTEDELHQMADAIGVRRRWFQSASAAHYDICKTKRAAAVKLGAVEVTKRELVRVIREGRSKNA